MMRGWMITLQRAPHERQLVVLSQTPWARFSDLPSCRNHILQPQNQRMPHASDSFVTSLPKSTLLNIMLVSL